MNERIKELRKSLNVSQNAFAQALGLSRNFICLLEKGDRDAGDRTIRDICDIYGVNEDWLRTGTGEMYKPLDREGEVARIADVMLNDVDPYLKTKLIRMVADAPGEDLELFVQKAREFIAAVDDKETPAD